MSPVQHSPNSGPKSKPTKVAVKVTRKARSKRRRATGTTEKSVSDEEYIFGDQVVMNIDPVSKNSIAFLFFMDMKYSEKTLSRKTKEVLQFWSKRHANQN